MPSGDTAATIDITRRANRSVTLQRQIRSLKPSDRKRLRDLAAREGYDVDDESFGDARDLPQVNRFRRTVSGSAGRLHLSTR